MKRTSKKLWIVAVSVLLTALMFLTMPLSVMAKTAAVRPIEMLVLSSSNVEISSENGAYDKENLTYAMEFYADGKVAIACLPQTWVEELQVTEDDLDSISGFPRTVDGVCVGVMIRDSEPGRAKMSVRTAGGYNASAYCSKLGGGGHHAAAGCSIPGTLETGKEAILQILREENVISKAPLEGSWHAKRD